MANYGTEAGFDTYADARGHTVPDGDALAALVRASAYIDAKYGGRFPGVPTEGRDQDLAWPRMETDGTPVTDVAGNDIPIDEVPREIERATYEAVMRELETPGVLFPDLDRGGAIKSLRAGSVGVEYTWNAPAETTFTIIDGILSGLIGGRSVSLAGTSSRA